MHAMHCSHPPCFCPPKRIPSKYQEDMATCSFFSPLLPLLQGLHRFLASQSSPSPLAVFPLAVFLLAVCQPILVPAVLTCLHTPVCTLVRTPVHTIVSPFLDFCFSDHP